MANAVIMPKAGITVESCIIGKWEKKIGESIHIGDVLFTYETDKASFECESTAEGTLLEIFFGEGEEVPCLINVCAIGAEGEDCSHLRPNTQETVSTGSRPINTPLASAVPVAITEGRGAVSPRAQKLADRAGVDPTGAVPTGPNGRVIERDIRRLMEDGESKIRDTLMTSDEYEDVKFSGIRRAISRSMHTSLSTMAQLTHSFSFDASDLLACRKRFKADLGEGSGITIGDMILFAVSRTLLCCPDLNAHMLDDQSIRLFKHVNLGVAVDTPRGLMVPTIYHADEMSLLDISKAVKELATQARSGAISPDKLSGASFTVSNLGGFGVESFTPVINPPQTGIIGVCTTVQRPRIDEDGNLELYPAMALSLTYDHRAIDGAPASRYMQELCKQLENFSDLLEAE